MAKSATHLRPGDPAAAGRADVYVNGRSLPLAAPALGLLAAAAGTPLLVLTYHRVLAEPDPFMPGEPDAGLFRHHLEFLARHLRPLPLTEAVDRLRAGTLPRRAVAVTFDDGYANNHHVALPLLKAVGVPATFFVATGYLDGGCMWNDALLETLRRGRPGVLDLSSLGLGRHELGTVESRRSAFQDLVDQLKYRPPAERGALVEQVTAIAEVDLPRDLMMTSDEVRDLHREGMELGGHTVSHPILARLEDGEAREEIAAGRRRLQEICGVAPRAFAYPNGRPGDDYLPRHTAMVEEAGFDFAMSTITGCATRGSPLYELPRACLWSRSPLKLAVNVARLYGREITGRR
jgi:peptidoglycan/xylan/chitin deacetylase (PgdA/CDA1 family)